MQRGAFGKLTAAAAALYKKQDNAPISNPFIAAIAAVSQEESVEVWPENHLAFDVFCALRTQWRVGQFGPTGLDYNVLYCKLDRLGLSPEESDQLESDIRIMELEALNVMNEAD